MNKSSFLLFLFVLPCFTSCKSKQANQKETNFFSRHKQTTLLGRWHYTNTIWYTAELMLNEDGEFKFYAQNCFGKAFTWGRWFKQNEIIVLSSDATYRPTSKDVRSRFLSPEDTIRTFFNNERLQLKNDTLFFIGENKILNGHKFTKELIPYLSSTSH